MGVGDDSWQPLNGIGAASDAPVSFCSQDVPERSGFGVVPGVSPRAPRLSPFTRIVVPTRARSGYEVAETRKVVAETRIVVAGWEK